MRTQRQKDAAEYRKGVNQKIEKGKACSPPIFAQGQPPAWPKRCARPCTLPSRDPCARQTRGRAPSCSASDLAMRVMRARENPARSMQPARTTATVCLDTTCAGGDPAPTLSSPRTPQHAPMLETWPRNRPHRRHLSLRLVNLTRALILTCTLTCTALGRESNGGPPPSGEISYDPDNNPSNTSAENGPTT